MATTAKTTQRRTKTATKRVAKKATATKRATTKRVAKKATATKRGTKRVAKKVARSTRKPATKATTSAPRGARQDAIAVLKQDHRHVEQLFKQFERAGDGAHRAKRQLVDGMIEALSRHTGIEELVFYPAVRSEVTKAEAKVLESLEEHHVVKWLLHELEDLDARAERFEAKVTVLIENVRHHVREEETTLFPTVRKRITQSRLFELGDELRAAKPRVPSRPHPGAPDDWPANAIVGGAVAVIDKARNVGKRAVDRVRSEVA